MTSLPAPYVVVYRPMIRKHVVIEEATGKVVAERVTWEAARNKAQRLSQVWLAKLQEEHRYESIEGVRPPRKAAAR